jgi:diguanylate cyclase (GGDEF)-like protein
MVDMHAGRQTAAMLLAVLYALSGVLCLVGAIRPMDSDTPVGLLAALGAIGLVGGLVLGTRAGRLGDAALHTAVAVMSVLLGVLAWQSATAVGIVGLGPAMICLELFVAHYFHRPAARVQTALLVVSASLGAWAAEPSGFLNAWITVIVSVVALGEGQNRIAQQLRAAADTDPLTKVANRRAWEAESTRHLARAARTGEPVAFAILDLDDFKEVNDRDGHIAGDLLLRELTRGWTRRLRRADLLGRYGGDEFVLCLPATDEHGAREVLDQLDATHEFRWSVGLTTARRDDTVASVLARADADLYEHKRSGRRA